MLAIPNPYQVAIIIQAIFDIGVGTPGAIDNAAQLIKNLNGNQALEITSNIAQTTATVVCVGTLVGLAGTGLVVGKTAITALINLTKNLKEIAFELTPTNYLGAA